MDVVSTRIKSQQQGAAVSPDKMIPFVRYDPTRRTNIRQRVDIKARLISADGRTVADADIVEMSLHGALVKGDFPAKRFGKVFLENRVDGNIYECEINWKSSLSLDVKFLDQLGVKHRRQFLATVVESAKRPSVVESMRLSPEQKSSAPVTEVDEAPAYRYGR